MKRANPVKKGCLTIIYDFETIEFSSIEESHISFGSLPTKGNTFFYISGNMSAGGLLITSNVDEILEHEYGRLYFKCGKILFRLSYKEYGEEN